MPDAVVAVGEGGSIYRVGPQGAIFSQGIPFAPGSLYFWNTFQIGDPLPCGTVDVADCARRFLGRVFSGVTDPDVSAAALIGLEKRLDDQLSDQSLALLTFAPGGAVPFLDNLANLAAYSGGLVPLLESAPQLAAFTDRVSGSVVEQLYATTVRDPRDGKNIQEQILDGLERIPTYAGVVAEERTKAMGLLESLGISGFSNQSGGGGGSVFGSSLYTDVFGAGSAFGLPGSGYGFPEDGGGVVYDGGQEGIFGGLLNTAIGAAPQILQILAGLSQAGVIRGSVGSFLAPGAMTAQAVTPGAMTATSPGGSTVPSLFDLLLSYGNAYAASQTTQTTNPATGLPMVGVPMGAAAARCGVSRTTVVNAMSAPGIFNVNSCGRVSTAQKIIAERIDGRRDLLVRVGEINSPSPRAIARFAKRWAKQAGLSCGPRGRSRPRARRVYRRRPR